MDEQQHAEIKDETEFIVFSSKQHLGFILDNTLLMEKQEDSIFRPVIIKLRNRVYS